MASFRKFTGKTGKTTWEARIHRRGVAVLSKRFKTKIAAQVWANSIEVRADRGEAAPVRLAASLTVQVVMAEFLKNNAIPAASKSHFHLAAHDLGDLSIRSMNHTQLQNWLDLLTGFKTHTARLFADSSARKAFYALKRALEWHAKKEGYPLPANLFDVDRVPAAWGQARERLLAPGEFDALKKSALSTAWLGVEGAVWSRFIEFAIETAMRQQEIVLAQWSHLSPDGRLLYIPPANEKTKQGRHVPLSPRARELVSAQRKEKDKGERIFEQIRLPLSNKVAGKGFAAIASDAGCPDLTFHDLRHEGTTRLCLSKKVDLLTAISITGHANMTTFKRYVALLRHPAG